MPRLTGAFDDDFSTKQLTDEDVKRAVLRFQELKTAQSELDALVEPWNEGAQKVLEELASLQARMDEGKEPLTDLEMNYLGNLRDALKVGDHPPEYVGVQDLLLKKVGPEKFKRIQMRKAEHEAERDLLRQTNDELQRQVELMIKANETPIPIGAGGDVVVYNTDSIPRTTAPGTYVVEVGAKGRVTAAHLITPKEAKPKLTFWERVVKTFVWSQGED